MNTQGSNRMDRGTRWYVRNFFNGWRTVCISAELARDPDGPIEAIAIIRIPRRPPRPTLTLADFPTPAPPSIAIVINLFIQTSRFSNTGKNIKKFRKCFGATHRIRNRQPWFAIL